MRNYKKFSNEELLALEKTFKMSSFYPDRNKIKKLARSLKTSPSKIDNWFKYKRRKMYYIGNFSQYKIRKIFAKKENDYLNSIFEEHQTPNYQKCKEISSQMTGVTTYQIKNWFSNRRRKLRNDIRRKMKNSSKPDQKAKKPKIKPTGRSKMSKSSSKEIPEEIKSPEKENEETTKVKKEENINTRKAQVETQKMLKLETFELNKEKKEENETQRSDINLRTTSILNEGVHSMNSQFFWPNYQVMNLANYQNSPNAALLQNSMAARNFNAMNFFNPSNLNLLQYNMNMTMMSPAMNLQNFQWRIPFPQTNKRNGFLS